MSEFTSFVFFPSTYVTNSQPFKRSANLKQVKEQQVLKFINLACLRRTGACCASRNYRCRNVLTGVMLVSQPQVNVCLFSFSSTRSSQHRRAPSCLQTAATWAAPPPAPTTTHRWALHLCAVTSCSVNTCLWQIRCAAFLWRQFMLGVTSLAFQNHNVKQCKHNRTQSNFSHFLKWNITPTS